MAGGLGLSLEAWKLALALDRGDVTSLHCTACKMVTPLLDEEMPYSDSCTHYNLQLLYFRKLQVNDSDSESVTDQFAIAI
jgi:hypothetical protein